MGQGTTGTGGMATSPASTGGSMGTAGSMSHPATAHRTRHHTIRHHVVHHVVHHRHHVVHHTAAKTNAMGTNGSMGTTETTNPPANTPQPQGGTMPH
jgi:hypothetical protein